MMNEIAVRFLLPRLGALKIFHHARCAPSPFGRTGAVSQHARRVRAGLDVLCISQASIALTIRPRCAPPCCVRDEVPTALHKGSEELCIGTVEPADMPACIAILMDAFYKDILTLASDEFRRCPSLSSILHPK